MNPITRKETFLAAAGGQDVNTPTPITREEVFLDAIAKSGGGGGSSGGGGLKVGVNVTESGDNTIYTLDKTWKQISDAIESGNIPYMIDYENGFVNTLSSIRTYEHDSGMGYVVEFNHEYQTDSENGYPTYEQQGGWE